MIEKLHRICFFEIDPFIIGVYRIYTGLFMLLMLAMLGPNWMAYYGPEGISPIPNKSISDYRPFEPVLNFLTTGMGLWLYYAISLVACVTLTLGIYARTSMAWLWIMTFSITYRNPMLVNGEEQVLAILTFYSMFLPLNASFSYAQMFVEKRRGSILENDHKVKVWTLMPIQIHIMLMYLLSWPHKLTTGDTWKDGTAVYYAMMARNYPRWPGMEIFAWNDAILSRITTYFTLVLELVAPLLVWFRRLRAPIVILCLILHVALGVLLEGVLAYNGATIAAFILFLPSRQTRELCRTFVGGSDWLGALGRYVIGKPVLPKPFPLAKVTHQT